ncbi:MAG: histidine phosphatase family protein [Patescibacteria group bacterium]
MSELEVRFIRHAKGSHMLAPELIAGRSIDATITGEGRADAFLKGKELAARGVSPDRVVSSSAVRCVQTGQAILDVMGIERVIEVVDELLEMDQGKFVGRVRTEVYNETVRRQILEQGKDFALPGGESMNQVGRRGLTWLKKQEDLATVKDHSVLAIAHGGLITHTVGTILGWDQAQSLAMLRSMPPLGETLVRFDGEQWLVESFAEPPVAV